VQILTTQGHPEVAYNKSYILTESRSPLSMAVSDNPPAAQGLEGEERRQAIQSSRRFIYLEMARMLESFAWSDPARDYDTWRAAELAFLKGGNPPRGGNGRGWVPPDQQEGQ